jgi:hypothetical protein
MPPQQQHHTLPPISRFIRLTIFLVFLYCFFSYFTFSWFSLTTHLFTVYPCRRQKRRLKRRREKRLKMPLPHIWVGILIMQWYVCHGSLGPASASDMYFWSCHVMSSHSQFNSYGINFMDQPLLLCRFGLCFFSNRNQWRAWSRF